MLKYLPFIFFFVLIAAGCSPKFQSRNEPQQDLYIEFSDSTFNLEMLYLAATSRALIFEADYINLSNKPIQVKRKDFSIKNADEKTVSEPYSTEDLIDFLEFEHKEMKAAQKRRTAETVLAVLTNAVFGIWGNAGVGESLIFSVEEVLYLSSDRRLIRRDLTSIEEEMDYVRLVNLDSSLTVQPNDTAFFELVFPFDNRGDDVEISYRKDSLNSSMQLTAEDLYLN